MRKIKAPARAQMTMWPYGVTTLGSEDSFEVFALFVDKGDAEILVEALDQTLYQKSLYEIVEMEYEY